MLGAGPGVYNLQHMLPTPLAYFTPGSMQNQTYATMGSMPLLIQQDVQSEQNDKAATINPAYPYMRIRTISSQPSTNSSATFDPAFPYLKESSSQTTNIF